MPWIETTSPKVFTGQPTPPYLTIDLWHQGDDIYKCTKARTSSEAFNASDWTVATPAEEAKSEAQAAITAAGEAKEIAEKTANHVFVDGEGLHVSSQEGDASQGWNTLLSSQGMAVRDGQDPELEIGSHETSVQKWSHLNAKSPLWISSESGSVSITGVDDQGNPTEMGIGIVEGENGEIDAIVQGHSIYIGNGDGKFGKLADWVTDYGKTGGWSWEKWASGKATCIGTFTRVCKASTLSGTSDFYYVSNWDGTGLRYTSFDFPSGLFADTPDTPQPGTSSPNYGWAIQTMSGSVHNKDKCSFAYMANREVVANAKVTFVIRSEGRWK